MTTVATVAPVYRGSTTLSIAPEGVASSPGFVAGVESAVYDNTSNKDVDVLIGGVWTSGTTPTANTQVLIYLFAVRDDAPTYPDVFDGTSSAETLTSAGVGRGFLQLAASIDVDAATSNRPYDVWFSAKRVFGGTLPPKFGMFITHNTGVNSHATAGNHVWKATGVGYTVTTP